MKFVFMLFLFSGSIAFTAAQPSRVIDSLQPKLRAASREDTVRVTVLSALADYYGFVQFDSCLLYAAKVYELSQKINYPLGSYLGYKSTFFAFNCQGNFPRALEAAINFLTAGELLKKVNPLLVVGPHYFLGLLNREMGDYPNAVMQLQEAIRLQREAGAPLPDVFLHFRSWESFIAIRVNWILP